LSQVDFIVWHFCLSDFLLAFLAADFSVPKK